MQATGNTSSPQGAATGLSATAPRSLAQTGRQTIGDRLTNREAASYLGVTEGTLNNWRSCGRYKIPYVRVGRLIQYSRRALDDWLASRTVGADGSAA